MLFRSDVTLPITNTGILVKSAGSGIARLGDSVVIGGATYSNTVDLFNASAGVVDVQSGSLNLSNGYFNQFGTLNVHSGASLARGLGFTNNGTIRGSGSLDLGSGTLTNAGTISPGGSGTAGTLTLNGNLALGSTSQLQIDLLGSTPAANDKLVVNGSASIGGTLTATLAPGYTPLAGATAGDILTATSLSGSFATNNLPTDVSGTTLNPPVMVTPKIGRAHV